MTLARSLKAIEACEEAVEWSKGYATLTEAWEACERGDWMLWLCGRMMGEEGWPTRQKVVLVACDCAELSLPIFEREYPDDKRPRTAIETARQWANGKASIEDVRNAAYTAAYAAATASSSAAYTVAYAAAYAAADASYAAAYAAADAVDAAMLRECADLCRKGLKIPATLRMP